MPFRILKVFLSTEVGFYRQNNALSDVRFLHAEEVVATRTFDYVNFCKLYSSYKVSFYKGSRELSPGVLVNSIDDTGVSYLLIPDDSTPPASDIHNADSPIWYTPIMSKVLGAYDPARRFQVWKKEGCCTDKAFPKFEPIWVVAAIKEHGMLPPTPDDVLVFTPDMDLFAIFERMPDRIEKFTDWIEVVDTETLDYRSNLNRISGFGTKREIKNINDLINTMRNYFEDNEVVPINYIPHGADNCNPNAAKPDQVLFVIPGEGGEISFLFARTNEAVEFILKSLKEVKPGYYYHFNDGWFDKDKKVVGTLDIEVKQKGRSSSCPESLAYLDLVFGEGQLTRDNLKENRDFFSPSKPEGLVGNRAEAIPRARKFGTVVSPVTLFNTLGSVPEEDNELVRDSSCDRARGSIKLS